MSSENETAKKNEITINIIPPKEIIDCIKKNNRSEYETIPFHTAVDAWKDLGFNDCLPKELQEQYDAYYDLQEKAYIVSHSSYCKEDMANMLNEITKKSDILVENAGKKMEQLLGFKPRSDIRYIMVPPAELKRCTVDAPDLNKAFAEKLEKVFLGGQPWVKRLLPPHTDINGNRFSTRQELILDTIAQQYKMSERIWISQADMHEMQNGEKPQVKIISKPSKPMVWVNERWYYNVEQTNLQQAKPYYWHLLKKNEARPISELKKKALNDIIKSDSQFRNIHNDIEQWAEIRGDLTPARVAMLKEISDYAIATVCGVEAYADKSNARFLPQWKDELKNNPLFVQELYQQAHDVMKYSSNTKTIKVVENLSQDLKYKFSR